MQIAEMLIKADANKTLLVELIETTQKYSKDPTWASILPDLERLNSIVLQALQQPQANSISQIIPTHPSTQITPMFQSDIKQGTFKEKDYEVHLKSKHEVGIRSDLNPK